MSRKELFSPTHNIMFRTFGPADIAISVQECAFLYTKSAFLQVEQSYRIATCTLIRAMQA